ncbi:MAG: ComF family protein [Tahibacter sp.]
MNARLKVDAWRRRLGFALLPPTCLLCGGAGAQQRDLCDGCSTDLVPNPRACERCALPLTTSDALCGRCLKRAPAFDAAWAPYLYESPLDLLLTRFKFGADLACGRVLSELAVARYAQAQRPPADALVPVPLHHTRLRERGCNQALELARLIAASLHIPLLGNVLNRVRATSPQTGLGALARRRNLRGAFATNPGAAIPRRIILIDDVMTTGTTLGECARVLKRAGAEHVQVWAIARAPRRRG